MSQANSESSNASYEKLTLRPFGTHNERCLLFSFLPALPQLRPKFVRSCLPHHFRCTRRLGFFFLLLVFRNPLQRAAPVRHNVMGVVTELAVVVRLSKIWCFT